MNPKVFLGPHAYAICSLAQQLVQSHGTAQVALGCHHIIQSIQREASSIYDSPYIGRKNIYLSLCRLKKHLFSLGEKGLIYRKIQDISKFLYNHNRGTAGSAFAELPDELNAKIVFSLPQSNLQEMKSTISILKMLYGRQEQLFYELIMPTWIENQNLQDRQFNFLPCYSQDSDITEEPLKGIKEGDIESSKMPSKSASSYQSLSKNSGLSQQALLSLLPFLQTLNYTKNQAFTDNSLEMILQYNHPYNLKLGGCVRISDQATKALHLLTKLQVLNIQHTLITESGLQQLTHLTNLRHLSLGSELITDGALRHVARLVQLQSVQLCCSVNATSAGLKHMTSLVNLKEMTLFGCLNISDNWIKHIGELTGLKSLHIDDSGFAMDSYLTEKGLQSLSKLTKLKVLELTYAFRDTESLKIFESFVRLRHLELPSSICITNANLKSIGTLTNLQTVLLEECSRIRGCGLKELSRLSSLHTLGLKNCRLETGFELQSLKHIPSLQHLVLNDCQRITDAVLADLAPLTNLKQLDLEGSYHITCRGLRYLQPLKKLDTLVISACKRNTKAGFRILKRLPNLQTLHLDEVKITDIELNEIGSLTSLKILRLSSCFGERTNGFKPLEQLTNLETLQIQHMHCTNEEQRALAALAHIHNFLA